MQQMKNQVLVASLVLVDDSCSNVATNNFKHALDANPMVTTNTNVSNVGDQSSSWGKPFLPSNAMPLKQNKGVTTS